MPFRDSLPPWLKHLLAEFHWATWLMIAVGIRALPRLLPHVGALVNVTAHDGIVPTFVAIVGSDVIVELGGARGYPPSILIERNASVCLTSLRSGRYPRICRV